MGRFHSVEKVTVENGVLALRVDGKSLSLQLSEVSPVLGRASLDELAVFEVTPSGYGIHWPLLDEDIAIDGLLGISHTPQSWRKSA